MASTTFHFRKPASLLLTLQLVEDPFEFVEFLAGFAEFAGGCQALVVGKDLSGLLDQLVCR